MMPATSDIAGYKVYYSPNQDMSGKQILGENLKPVENPPGTYTLTCPEVDLESNKTYYFTVVALKTNNTELPSDTFSTTYTEASLPGPVQDFRKETTSPTKITTTPTPSTSLAHFALENNNNEGILNEVDKTKYGIVNGVTFTTGAVGNGAKFDSDTDYIRLSDSELDNIGILDFSSRTIEFTFIPSSTDPSYIINGSGENNAYIKYEWGSWAVAITKNWNVVLGFHFDHAVSVGTPITISITWDIVNATASVTVDGSAATISYTNQDGGAAPINMSVMYLGCQSQNSENYAHGVLDEVYIK
jgi:hypothetical protein